jgi:predicted  nucleic acid-binding Zn-ribbon protein
MENLKQDLELLYELQNYDTKIDNIKEQIRNVPSLIEEKNKILEAKRNEIDVKKKNFVNLSFFKKEKESILDSKEKAISKFSMELNTVKSNDTYKSLLLEIEKAKADKNVIEDELLEIMYKFDKESIVFKASESELRDFEQKIKADIFEIENTKKKFEDEMLGIEQAREDHKLKISKVILAQYERLREGRDGQGIALVDGESCGACGMVLRPQLINQAQKVHDLVFCDNCSRILLKK